MKKIIKLSLIVSFISLGILAYWTRPAIYYGWDSTWENFQIIIKQFYINLSPDRSLNQNATSLLQYINSNATLKNNYKKAFSWAQNDDDFIWRTYSFWFFKGFSPIKIEDKCFIFKANDDVLSKSVWGEIRKYKKESPTSTAECNINCSVYFTEKWLLSEEQIYSCN